jgi:hypothetical protein
MTAREVNLFCGGMFIGAFIGAFVFWGLFG